MKKLKSVALLSYVTLFSGFGCTSISASDNSDKPGWLTYMPDKVVLEGALVTEDKYGPPNFGEDPSKDMKVRIYVLRLAQPINIKGDSGVDPNDPDTDSYSNITEVQVEQTNDINFDGFVGKNIHVTGVLHEQLTPGDYMKVVMDVEQITIEPK